MLPDVITEWTDWPGELQTITGFTLDEYRTLNRKLSEPSFELEQTDEAMMTEAAKQFLGYPGMTTNSVEKALGSDWLRNIEDAFLSERK